MRESEFNFGLVQLMHCKCNRINFRSGGSYIDSPDWIKKKKATINPKNKNDECFQYVAMVALSYGETESHPERVWNIKPFLYK